MKRTFGPIRTEHVLPPIPTRSFDWSAVFDDRYEEGDLVGRGETELEAICDLITQELERLQEEAE
jgi:hypothetical protein